MRVAGSRNTARRLQKRAEQEPTVHQNTHSAVKLLENEGAYADDGAGSKSAKRCPGH
jgi:hypothetical protein